MAAPAPGPLPRERRSSDRGPLAPVVGRSAGHLPARGVGHPPLRVARDDVEDLPPLRDLLGPLLRRRDLYRPRGRGDRRVARARAVRDHTGRSRDPRAGRVRPLGPAGDELEARRLDLSAPRAGDGGKGPDGVCRYGRGRDRDDLPGLQLGLHRQGEGTEGPRRAERADLQPEADRRPRDPGAVLLAPAARRPPGGRLADPGDQPEAPLRLRGRQVGRGPSCAGRADAATLPEARSKH